MVEISQYGSGVGPGKETTRGYSTHLIADGHDNIEKYLARIGQDLTA